MQFVHGSLGGAIIVLYAAGAISFYYVMVSESNKTTYLKIVLVIYSALLATMLMAGVRFLSGGGF